MDKAVNSVMAALMWHTQDIREELAPFGEEGRQWCALLGGICAVRTAYSVLYMCIIRW